MILSLVNDADEQFMEDVMLKEAEPFEVKQVTSVLQGLSSSCEERESSFVRRGRKCFLSSKCHSRYRYRTLEKCKNSRKSGAISCKFKESQCQQSILHVLTGKAFVRILKSLDIPCFSGKGKGTQIDTLKKNSLKYGSCQYQVS